MASHQSKSHNRQLHQARVLELCGEIQTLLRLDWITVVHRYTDEKDDTQATLCQTEVEWKYHQAVMTWHVGQLSCATDESLWETAIHEFVHVMLGPIHYHLKPGSHINDLEEFATETVAVALLHLINQQFHEDGSKVCL